MTDKQPCHDDAKSSRHDANLGQEEAASEKAGKEKMSHMEGKSRRPAANDLKRKDRNPKC
jgi:hypothetical protein